MKSTYKKVLAAAVSALILASTTALSVFAQDNAEKEYMNVGYAFRRGLAVEELDLSVVTHLNYSFGLIYNREVPPNPDEELNPDCQTPEDFNEALLNTIYLPDDAKSDLTKLKTLKKEKNPDLKVMLSVGGWNARGFSDAASTEEGRKAFAKSCKDVIDEYDLAGIDLDWEYPTIDWANIKTRPEDPQNFTLLLKEVRSAIGNDKLLSIAGSANVNFPTGWVEFKEVVDILDYINIMTYDFHYGTCYYGSSLYASKKFPTSNPDDEYNADFGIQNYIKNGCPPEKINMGIAYAVITRPDGTIVTDKDKADNDIAMKNLQDCGFFSKDSKMSYLERVNKLLENKTYTREDGTTYKFDKKWDTDAQISYIATYDNEGNEIFVLSYPDTDGIKAKTDYVKKYGLGGTMFWQFGDDYDNILTTLLANELGIKEPAPVETEAVTTQPEATEAVTDAQSTTATPTDTEETTNPKTGNAVPASICTIFAASVAALIISKKKK